MDDGGRGLDSAQARPRSYRANVFLSELASVGAVAVVGFVTKMDVITLTVLAAVLTLGSLVTSGLVWKLWGDRLRQQGWRW